MIDDKFIVTGEDFKNLPLRVLCYRISYYGNDGDINFMATIDSMKRFVKNGTKWKIVAEYEEPYDSNLFIDEQRGKALREIKKYAGPFDLIVVSNFYQILRDKLTISELLEKEELTIPVFCIETGDIITAYPKLLKNTIFIHSNINESRKRTSETDYIHMGKEVRSDEE